MSTTANNKVLASHGLLLSLLLLLVAGVYWRGLSSAFLFDDAVNLDALGHVGSSIFDRSLWDFVLGGSAGPLGRPLSLLSFAMQAPAWPDDPFAFKLVNLLIHAVNSVLVYALCVLCCRTQRLPHKDTLLVAGLCTALWALHPLHVTAVLYTVQRMTLLCSTFMLAGLLCYLHYRPKVTAATTWKDLLPLTTGLGGSALLALLAKENAASLLLYVMALEYTIFTASKVSTVFNRWRMLVLWVPFMVLVASTMIYVLVSTESFVSKLGFSRLDRLLSESRILWTYLGQLFSPDILSTQLFHSPRLSTSLFAPITTLLATLAWLAVLVLACVYRCRLPVLALAVFWFLAGHSIEGSVIPLELYFNHRNYLAIVGPLFAFLYLLVVVREKMPASARVWLLAIPGLMVAVNGWQTSYNAALWRDPLQLAADWFTHDPSEVRSAEFYAIKIARTGEAGAQEASDIYDGILQNNPTMLRPLFNRLLLACISPAIALPETEVVNAHIEQSNSSEMDVLTPINELVQQSLTGACAAVGPDYLEGILRRAVPRLGRFNQPAALFALGRIRQLAGDNAAALDFYNQAFAISHDAGILFAKAILQMNMQDPLAALLTIDAALALVLEHNDIQTGARVQKIKVLHEMQLDAETLLGTASAATSPQP